MLSDLTKSLPVNSNEMPIQVYQATPSGARVYRTRHHLTRETNHPSRWQPLLKVRNGLQGGLLFTGGFATGSDYVVDPDIGTEGATED